MESATVNKPSMFDRVIEVLLYIDLIFSVLQTKTDTCAKSVDPDKMAHNKPSHLYQYCLPFCFLF